MKTLKLITVVALTALFGFTSCQSEESSETGTNPNANSATSPTASNYKRAAMNDGADDDFLDGNSCTELLFPLTAAVNGQTITLLTRLDLSIALSIIGEFNNDSDVVTFDFPINVRTSSYSEIVVSSQSDFDALKEDCENAEAEGEDAVSCVTIDFPVTMLTYNISVEQTGSVVVQSKEQLYLFITDLQSDALFSVNYPVSAALSNGTTLEINSDAAFQNAISECTQSEEEEEEAAETANEVEAILSGTTFEVETFVIGGANTANEYADYTFEFTNDLKLIARNSVNVALEDISGTYEVSSETAAFVNIDFESNTAVGALSNDWIVNTYSSTLVTFSSKTDASVTLAFQKI
ncbi:MAG: hypothetical protein ACI6PN_05205 [Polaribacter sp.]|uniref:hypothetical protein n=1 Tax=Polaribacter sp. TaxID=1920175 RepID=UPI00384AED96